MKDNVRTQADMMKKINDLTLPGGIVVFGSTYMSSFPLYELVNKCIFENAVYNRSIQGLTVTEALEIVEDCVIDIHPSKVFISLGEEDEDDPDATEKYALLISKLRSCLPGTNLYLIGLTGKGAYVDTFNQSILGLCDGKTVKYIQFTVNHTSERNLYKARFKQLSCFFRNNRITMPEAFGIASI